MILIVEDDPQVARLISLVLSRNGYSSETVADGTKALDKIREEKPGLVFADLTLKGMTGERLCMALKEQEATRDIPFVVLSGDRDIAEKARQCGANAHLGKPFEFDDLIRIVETYANSEKRQTT